MALLLAAAVIFGSSYESKKTIIEKQILSLLLVSLLAYVAVPQFALAYEVELKNAPARKLIAPIRLLHNTDFQQNTDVVYGLENLERLSGSVLSSSPVETKSGTWPSQLAYSEPIQYSTPNNVPTLGSPIVLEGEASYYSRAGCLGCSASRTMANGQSLNDGALTMAIGANLKHLVGYRAKVTNLNTSLSVDVLITDTGGFYKEKYGSRVADLTIASKQAIGMYGGVGQVRVEVY